MKIVTWNINSVRLRLDLLKKLSEQYAPEIICLQETKVQDHLFPKEEIRKLGYEYIFYAGEKSYNGVAILSKIQAVFSSSLQLFNNDTRHIAVKINDLELHNFYVPAGGDIPDANLNLKFRHKLEYVNTMQQWLLQNRTKNDKLILVGDLNIAPHEHDVWSSKQLRNIVSHTDIERESLLKLQNSFGFVDSARHFIPMSKKLYTWWSYRNQDWQKSNRGRRLDHIWVSKNLQNYMQSIEVISEARNWHKPSDHVPYLLSID